MKLLIRSKSIFLRNWTRIANQISRYRPIVRELPPISQILFLWQITVHEIRLEPEKKSPGDDNVRTRRTQQFTIIFPENLAKIHKNSIKGELKIFKVMTVFKKGKQSSPQNVDQSVCYWFEIKSLKNFFFYNTDRITFLNRNFGRYPWPVKLYKLC